MKGDLKRIAAHEVVLPDGRVLHQAVVELVDGKVVNCYEFTGELPMCEWRGGRIEIRS
jgi:hypothetical protein